MSFVGHPCCIPIVQEGYPVLQSISELFKGAAQAPAGRRARSWFGISGALLAVAIAASSLATVSPAQADESRAYAAPGSESLTASAFAVPAWDGNTVLASQGYYPPRYRAPQHSTVTHHTWHRGPDGWFTVRGGFFDTQDVPKNDWLAGMKLTGVISKGVEMGIMSDYQRRSHSLGERIDEYRDPSGNVVRTSVPTAEVSSSLIPVMGVLELRVPTPGLQPYVGGGAGYEWLITDGDDFVNQQHFSDTFGGFGFQGYGGITVAFNEKARLNAEAFYNHSTVSRTFFDDVNGYEVKQQIDVQGGGIRGGLSFAF